MSQAADPSASSSSSTSTNATVATTGSAAAAAAASSTSTDAFDLDAFNAEHLQVHYTSNLEVKLYNLVQLLSGQMGRHFEFNERCYALMTGRYVMERRSAFEYEEGSDFDFTADLDEENALFIFLYSIRRGAFFFMHALFLTIKLLELVPASTIKNRMRDGFVVILNDPELALVVAECAVSSSTRMKTFSGLTYVQKALLPQILNRDRDKLVTVYVNRKSRNAHQYMQYVNESAPNYNIVYASIATSVKPEQSNKIDVHFWYMLQSLGKEKVFHNPVFLFYVMCHDAVFSEHLPLLYSRPGRDLPSDIRVDALTQHSVGKNNMVPSIMLSALLVVENALTKVLVGVPSPASQALFEMIVADLYLSVKFSSLIALLYCVRNNTFRRSSVRVDDVQLSTIAKFTNLLSRIVLTITDVNMQQANRITQSQTELVINEIARKAVR
jgi:hypothetical protein